MLVVVLAVKALTLPGASRGLAFLFTPSVEGLTNYRTWLEALTQNASARTKTTHAGSTGMGLC